MRAHKHEWWYNEADWIESCCGAICVKCGEMGCWHDVEREGVPFNVFFYRRAKSSKQMNIRRVIYNRKKKENSNVKKGKIIAVDFDGVIANYNGFIGKGNFGTPIKGVMEALLELKNRGHKILINTTRSEIKDIEDYLDEYGIPYDYINDSPINRESDLSPAKQCADIYIDDRCVQFTGSWDYGFVDMIENFSPWWRK
jgi:adenylylsulfate kinase